MKYLLDVNILVAWGWADHPAHTKVLTWMNTLRAESSSVLYTVPIVRLGFVRVSMHSRRGTVTPQGMGTMLDGLLSGLGKRHKPLADDGAATMFPAWCHGASQTTDAHLLALAAMHGAKLATLDTGIPGAVLIG